MNFCPNCGTELTKDAKFCPNCGERLDSKNDHDDRSHEITEINVDKPAPNAVKGGMSRDFKAGRILAYKKALGLDTGIDNVLIGQIAYTGRLLLFGSASILTAKLFVMSFEKEGIVMFGMSNWGHFKSKNAFIPADTIKKITYKNRMMKKVLSIYHADTKVKLYVTSMIVGSPFQKKNVQNIDNIIDQYK